jgi:biopolymer transport protein ExbD
LIDVLFLLLTFFLVTATFIEQSALKVELPSMQHPDRVQQQKRFVLEVGSGGEMRYEGEAVDRESLRGRLGEGVAEINAGGGIVLRADRGASHGEVMAVLDLIRGAGIRRFVIAAAEERE